MFQKRVVARGMTVVVVVVVAALAGMSAATPAVAAVRTNAPAPTVAWGECPEDVVDPLSALQCALIPVPLDYSDPDGVEIELMISRLASTDPSTRRGILMLNPGGPGDSGLDQSNSLVTLGLPYSVTRTYDLIGMDTRGLGHSSPISCGFTVEQDYVGAVPHFAVGEAGVAAEAESAKAVAAQCAANDVDGRLRHMTTANTARDMDQIRIALGEEKASYFGVSYGTALGAAYASMFPETSDRIVLDSNIGDTHLDRDGFRRYGLGAEETFPDFARWLAKRDGAYGMGNTEKQVREKYFELAGRLDAAPLGTFDGHDFRFNVFVTMYSEELYTEAAQLWQALEFELDKGGSAESAPGVVPATPALADNAFSIFLAVTCNDSEFTDDIGTYEEAVAEDRKKFPVFGAATANITPCAYWAYEPTEPPVPIVDDGPENILIVQNRHDPVTPYAGGELLREKFDQRSKMISADGSGHGVYIYGDNACTDNFTTAFLVDGTMPAKDQRC